MNTAHSIKRAAAEARFAQVQKRVAPSTGAMTSHEQTMELHRTNSDRLKDLRLSRARETLVGSQRRGTKAPSS
jgi:hypothetical protein